MIRSLLFLGGAALFVVLLVHIGPAAIIASFSELSWRLPLILCFPFAAINTFDTLGWKFAFRRDEVPFTALLSARLAGEAVNATTPTASVGGEAVKTWLVRRWVAVDESLPSVIVAKTSITIAQALFLLVGITVAWHRLPADSPFLWAMELLLALEIVGVGGFVLVQVSGAVGGAGRIVDRLAFRGAGGTAYRLRRVDSALASFYRQAPARLGLSIAAHFLGWACSALETYVILYALGVPVSPTTAIVIEAFGTGVRFASFMIPAHLGALEGGHVAIFAALGLTAPLGLTFSLVRRLREATWVAAGFIALGLLGAPVRRSAAVDTVDEPIG